MNASQTNELDIHQQVPLLDYQFDPMKTELIVALLICLSCIELTNFVYVQNFVRRYLVGIYESIELKCWRVTHKY